MRFGFLFEFLQNDTFKYLSIIMLVELFSDVSINSVNINKLYYLYDTSILLKRLKPKMQNYQMTL